MVWKFRTALFKLGQTIHYCIPDIDAMNLLKMAFIMLISTCTNSVVHILTGTSATVHIFVST